MNGILTEFSKYDQGLLSCSILMFLVYINKNKIRYNSAKGDIPFTGVKYS